MVLVAGVVDVPWRRLDAAGDYDGLCGCSPGGPGLAEGGALGGPESFQVDSKISADGVSD